MDRVSPVRRSGPVRILPTPLTPISVQFFYTGTTFLPCLTSPFCLQQSIRVIYILHLIEFTLFNMFLLFWDILRQSYIVEHVPSTLKQLKIILLCPIFHHIHIQCPPHKPHNQVLCKRGPLSSTVIRTVLCCLGDQALLPCRISKKPFQSKGHWNCLRMSWNIF